MTDTAVTMKVRPLRDRVVIRPTPREETTKGGVLLPDTATEKPQEGIVIAVGSGRILDNGQRVPLEVQEGQRVLYAKYAGTEVKIEGEEVLIVSEKDILGVIRS